MGQSLTLQCEVTTVRGITSRVDIVWSSDGTVLRRIGDTTATTVNDSLVYTDSYNISRLSTTDDGRVIQCEVVINISPLIMATNNVTLNVIGEYYVSIMNRLLASIIALHTVPTPTVTISPSGPIQGAMVGSPQVINCTVSTVSGVESSSVMISWVGPEGGFIISDNRVTISPTTSSGNNYASNLQFTYLMEGDEGTYTCNVMILETSGSQSFKVQSLSSKIFMYDTYIISLKNFTKITMQYTELPVATYYIMFNQLNYLADYRNLLNQACVAGTHLVS